MNDPKERDPQQGGSYLRDPETGELIPVKDPDPAPGADDKKE